MVLLLQALPVVRRSCCRRWSSTALVYYLLPLAVALVVLVADELRQRREQAARAGAFLGWLSRGDHAARPGRLHVPGRASCCSSRAPLRRRRAAWPGSTTSCRSA